MAAGKVQTKIEAGRPKAAARPSSAVPREKIAERAYQIWQESGCPSGQDQDHWFQAERELSSGPRASPVARR